MQRPQCSAAPAPSAQAVPTFGGAGCDGETGCMHLLRSRGLWLEGQRLKLHLGCGETHLSGYVNIDFPSDHHTVQTQPAADVYADIVDLSFPAQAVAEVRLHHVFEHFDRPVALCLLCKWHSWLQVGGQILVEVPDLRACALQLLLPWRSYRLKQVAVRHLYGSHEADWAVHRDGWDRARLERVVRVLGFSSPSFTTAHYKGTYNITLRASKTKHVSLPVLRRRISELLRDHLVDNSPTELRLLEVWEERVSEMLESGT